VKKKGFKLGLITLLLIMATVGLMGCGASNEDNQAGDTAKEEGKTYIVATDATFPPFETTLPSGEVVGFDIDLINAVAEAAGIKVEVQHLGWDPMLKAVENGKADIAAAGVTITEDKKQIYDFTSPYFEATQIIMVPADSDVTSIEDLKGKNVGFQSGTTGDLASQKFFGADYSGLKGYEDIPTAVNDLFTGRISAVIGDNAVLAELVKKTSSDKLKLIKEDSFEKEYYGLLVKKGNEELLAKLEEGLQQVQEDGTYQEIYSKYFAE